MRKFVYYLVAFCAIGGFGLVNAQSMREISDAQLIMPDRAIDQFRRGGLDNIKRTPVVCGPDSVGYTINKATGLRAISINNATSAQAGSQYFDCPTAITVHGFEFYAWASTTPPSASVTVNAEIYLAAADSTPMGAPLATTTVVVDSNFAPGTLDVFTQWAGFTTPVTVTQPYVLVVSNQSANNIAMVCSDYQAVPADGQAEWLGSADLTNLGGN